MLLPFSTNRFRIRKPRWHLVFIQQQAADQVRCDDLGRSGIKGSGEKWEDLIVIVATGRLDEEVLRDADRSAVAGLHGEYHLPLLAMSEEQLKAFLAALEADTGLQAKIKAAVEGEIDPADETAAVIAIAKEAGFTITAADLLRNEAQDILELSDEELEDAVGGGFCVFGSRGVGGTRAACGGGAGSVRACRATFNNGGRWNFSPSSPGFVSCR